MELKRLALIPGGPWSSPIFRGILSLDTEMDVTHVTLSSGRLAKTWTTPVFPSIPHMGVLAIVT